MSQDFLPPFCFLIIRQMLNQQPKLWFISFALFDIAAEVDFLKGVCNEILTSICCLNKLIKNLVKGFWTRSVFVHKIMASHLTFQSDWWNVPFFVRNCQTLNFTVDQLLVRKCSFVVKQQKGQPFCCLKFPSPFPL